MSVRREPLATVGVVLVAADRAALGAVDQDVAYGGVPAVAQVEHDVLGEGTYAVDLGRGLHEVGHRTYLVLGKQADHFNPRVHHARTLLARVHFSATSRLFPIAPQIG